MQSIGVLMSDVPARAVTQEGKTKVILQSLDLLVECATVERRENLTSQVKG